MKILFIGASKFGLRCLTEMYQLSEVSIVGVISNRENFNISYSKEGVSNVLYTDFELFTSELKIPFYRMERNMSEQNLVDFVKIVNPDYGIVVGWYHLIPKLLLNQFPFGGLHASLLPDYSGGAPLVWAMINGEKFTGISFFLFDEGVDSGAIISQKRVEINENDTIATLYQKIEELGIEILLEQIPKLANGSAILTIQDGSKRRVFPQRKPEDGLINWDWDSTRIKNFIRAQTKPYPGAFTILNNKKVIIWDADIFDV